MELIDLDQGLGAVADCGRTLNCQERIGLRAGLSLLCERQKGRLERVFFWGKILGRQADYYIAFSLRGTGPEAVPSKLFFYSGEDFSFLPLPDPDAKADRIEIASLSLPGLLTGDPCALLDPPQSADQAASVEAPRAVQREQGLTEVDRLASAVRQIDHETSVVPRGAYSLTENHRVVSAVDFRGLGFSEASSLEKFAHFRPPVSLSARRALARTDAIFYSDFLDTLDGDLPEGSWVMRQDASAGLVTLRSLSWPGYCAYHFTNTNRFGGFYCGYGHKCQDLAHML